MVPKPGRSSKSHGLLGKQILDFQDKINKLKLFPNYLKTTTDLHSSIREETLGHPSDSRTLGHSECFCMDVISAS